GSLCWATSSTWVKASGKVKVPVEGKSGTVVMIISNVLLARYKVITSPWVQEALRGSVVSHNLLCAHPERHHAGGQHHGHHLGDALPFDVFQHGLLHFQREPPALIPLLGLLRGQGNGGHLLHLHPTATGDRRVTAVHFIEDVLRLRQPDLTKDQEPLVRGHFTEVARLLVEEVHATVIELGQGARETVELGKKDFTGGGGGCYSSHGSDLYERG